MPVNSLYLKVTLKVLIMRRQNAYPNKCVAFKYNLVAVYQKSVKSSLQVTQMKNIKITWFQLRRMVHLLEITINNFFDLY